MSKIIIDTNIYLNFYRLNSGQSLEMLKNLNKLVKSKKFRLALPKQIEDEFIRNKNSKSAIYGDHILNFQKGLEVQFKVPYLIKSTQKIERIKRTVEKLKSLKEEAVEDYKNRVFNPNSKINQQLNRLFTNTHRPLETDMVLQRAWFRTLRGNPPRKDNSSFGDAIIWETILDQYTNDDLVFISGDGDFESEIKQGEIHELLQTEWSKKSGKKLTLYTELGSFINQQSKTKKKPIKEETIQEEDRLNSIFATSIPLSTQVGHGGTALGLSKSALIDSSSSLLSASSVWSGINKCTCCGAEIDQLSSYSMLDGSWCKNCRDSFSHDQICSKCGRHFHRDITSIYSFSDSRCDGCQGTV